MKSMLYQSEYKINEYISVKIPTLDEILNNEDDYYGAIALIVSTPYDMMVQLDDNNIDFTQINEWDLFCLSFNELQSRDLSMIFGDLNLNDFKTAVNKQNGNIVLRNIKTGAVIDSAIHGKISKFLREILHLEKNDKRPANEEAKKYMIERARIRLNRKKKQVQKSQLEDYIIALVNTSEFPYDYDSVRGLSIYQFYASLYQIVKKVKFDNLMIGCYAGTVNMKELDPNDLNWLSG